MGFQPGQAWSLPMGVNPAPSQGAQPPFMNPESSAPQAPITEVNINSQYKQGLLFLI